MIPRCGRKLILVLHALPLLSDTKIPTIATIILTIILTMRLIMHIQLQPFRYSIRLFLLEQD